MVAQSLVIKDVYYIFGQPDNGILRQLFMTNDIINNLKEAEQEYASTFLGLREIAKNHNVQRQVLTGWLLAKGYTIENRRALKSFNIHYFDEIDTEEKAYWLGFLFADGAITQCQHSYDIELSLKIDDKNHVAKFAKAVGKSYINNNSTYRSRCTLGSKHMFNVLSNYGCTTRKSLTLKFPNQSTFKDKHLIRHFIRGYVDGDGCLSWGNKEHTRCAISILGTKDFLTSIRNIFPTKTKLRNNSKQNEITKVLTYNGKLGFDFAKWLYQDSTISLDRKYNIYLEYCRLYE